MLKQLSIFAENKKGTMQQITQILFENDVNILGSVNNDSAEYGIVRMVVSDPDKAEQALQAAGYMTRQTDVLGVELTAHRDSRDAKARQIRGRAGEVSQFFFDRHFF